MGIVCADGAVFYDNAPYRVVGTLKLDVLETDIPNRLVLEGTR